MQPGRLYYSVVKLSLRMLSWRIVILLQQMVDPVNQLYPFCIVWTLIPCISWLFPFIGHTGICEYSQQLPVPKGLSAISWATASTNAKWLSAVHSNTSLSRQLTHNITTGASSKQTSNSAICLIIYAAMIIRSNNCHHHVAGVLNELKYEGRDDWSQLSIWWMCISRSQFVDSTSIFKIYLPILMILLVCIVWCYLAVRS